MLSGCDQALKLEDLWYSPCLIDVCEQKFRMLQKMSSWDPTCTPFQETSDRRRQHLGSIRE